MPDVLEGLQGALTGRYRFEREVGRGGMATVYLAQDLRHPGRWRSRCCIRTWPRASARTGSSARSRSPPASATRTSYRSIDSGSAGRLLYYVMPFIEGESLRERLDRGGRLRSRRRCDLAREVAARSTTRTGAASSTATSSPRT